MQGRPARTISAILKYPAVQDEIGNSTEPTKFSHHSRLNVQVSYIPVCSCFILLHYKSKDGISDPKLSFIVKKNKAPQISCKASLFPPKKQWARFEVPPFSTLSPNHSSGLWDCTFSRPITFQRQPATPRRPLWTSLGLKRKYIMQLHLKFD